MEHVTLSKQLYYFTKYGTRKKRNIWYTRVLKVKLSVYDEAKLCVEMCDSKLSLSANRDFFIFFSSVGDWTGEGFGLELFLQFCLVIMSGG